MRKPQQIHQLFIQLINYIIYGSSYMIWDRHAPRH
jgi:hypothetical protein